MAEERLDKTIEKGTERESTKKFNLPLFIGVLVLVAIVVIVIMTIIVGPPERTADEQILTEDQPQAALIALRTTYTTRLQTRGLPEDYTVEEAIQETGIEHDVLNHWTFVVEGIPPTRYIAVSTSEFPDGEGHRVIYDEETGEFVCIRRGEWLRNY